MHDACRIRGLTGAMGKAIALAALVFCLNGSPASADAGPETDNALATLCGIVESSAKAESLPVDFFTKLIWRESAFRPTAVSPAGAQGVAQFMPQTAGERGLIDPFDPASAIPASAKFLGELKRSASAIWAWRRRPMARGETAVANWIANKGLLPFETQDYVLAITGHDAEEWREREAARCGAGGRSSASLGADRQVSVCLGAGRLNAGCCDFTRLGSACLRSGRRDFARLGRDPSQRWPRRRATLPHRA